MTETNRITDKLQSLADTIDETKALNVAEDAAQSVGDALVEKYAGPKARPKVEDLPSPAALSDGHAGYYSTERFAALFSRSCRELGELYNRKGEEYRGSDDVLANFRRTAQRMALPLLTVWDGYAQKHLDSIEQYIQDDRNGVVRQRTESIGKKIDDAIVYLYLLKAMLDERGEL